MARLDLRWIGDRGQVEALILLQQQHPKPLETLDLSGVERDTHRGGSRSQRWQIVGFIVHEALQRRKGQLAECMVLTRVSGSPPHIEEGKWRERPPLTYALLAIVQVIE